MTTRLISLAAVAVLVALLVAGVHLALSGFSHIEITGTR